MAPDFFQPEHAGPFILLRGRVVEADSGSSRNLPRRERVLHEEEEVNVVRVGLSGDERAEDDETRQMACAARQVVNTRQALRDDATLRCADAEVFEHFA